MRGTHRIGFELKHNSAPRTTRSMHTALADLKLEQLHVIYPGDQTYPLADHIQAVGLSRILDDLHPLDGSS